MSVLWKELSHSWFAPLIYSVVFLCCMCISFHEQEEKRSVCMSSLSRFNIFNDARVELVKRRTRNDLSLFFLTLLLKSMFRHEQTS